MDGTLDEKVISARIIRLKRRYSATLLRLCELMPQAERDDVTAAIQKWAEVAGRVPELDRFPRRERLIGFPYGLRARARPITNVFRWPWA